MDHWTFDKSTLGREEVDVVPCYELFSFSSAPSSGKDSLRYDESYEESVSSTFVVDQIRV